MSILRTLTSIILINYCLFTQAQDVDEALVDYYVNLIANRSDGVQNFELPTDARMYEPKDKTVKAQDVDEALVDYYVNLIANRSDGVKNFELPTDARMYEPEDKTVKGKHNEAPLKVELLSLVKKKNLLQNSSKLKNTGIAIANDLTEQQREENKTLKKALHHCRKTTTEKSYIKGNKLHVGDKQYTAEELIDIDFSEDEKPKSAPPTPDIREHTRKETTPNPTGILSHTRETIQKPEETQKRRELDNRSTQKQDFKINKPKKPATIAQQPREKYLTRLNSTDSVNEYGVFDFIVVGAGSTGCIIANRLSEVEKWSVLLIEAGTFPGPDLSRIPSLTSTEAQTRYNWGYQSTPQKYACLGNTNGTCSLARGKGIGGTSLINGMFYARGNKLDYKKWADSLDDSSYTYKNLLPYFWKTENFTRTNFEAPIDWKYHGTKGPMHMTHSVFSSDLQEAIIEGSKKLGNSIVDYNGERQVGTGIVQHYLRNGFRDDPGLALISSAKGRTNLKVLENSYVIKLDISANNNRINGVIFTRDNKTFIARNRKEVILSAGSIGSPQILMLSGIGPENHLKSLDIPVIKNLPVGETLHDHPYVSLTFSTNASFSNASTEQLVRQLLKGEGRLTAATTFNTVLWLKLSEQNHDDNPDVEIVSHSIYLATYPDIPNPFTTLVGVMHPISKGSIQLKSADPFEYPLINTNHLSNDEDMEQLYEAFKIALKLTETEPFRRLNVTLAPTDPDECSQAPYLTKEFWLCYLRRRTMSGGHLISTCLTGKNPKNGVVDKFLKVFGLKDLRVADASVIPFSFANHPTATCFVIAEKISDQIKKEYLKELKCNH